jgi:hypothetical protein
MGLLWTLLACAGTTAPRATDAPADAPPDGEAAARGDTAPLDPARGDLVVSDVPHVVQRPDFCGEACAEMAARHFGLDIDQDDVFDLSGVDPALGRGVHAAELVVALERLGFDTGAGFFPAADADAVFAGLLDDLRAGVPSILCVHNGDGPGAPEHFVLVTGYDAHQDVFVYQDPAREDGADNRLSRARLLARWRLTGAHGQVLIRLRLGPVALTAPPPSPSTASRFTAADYAQAVLATRRRLPPGFTLVVEPPFVVVGDGPAAIVRARAEQTVRFAVQGLRRNHFDHDPEVIFTAWLFQDDASYYSHARAIFGHTPDTPYGYADLDEHALIMNIGTGGGTLVHEMVHPYLHAEMPDAPPWFNEGLASLYEGTTRRDGTLRGIVNWRLGDLQRLIRADMLLDFPTLMALDKPGFYTGASGAYYAESRYLCLWLQEQGLLEGYYRALRAATNDPTGVATLCATLGTDDLDAFQELWEAWVMSLQFP